MNSFNMEMVDFRFCMAYIFSIVRKGDELYLNSVFAGENQRTVHKFYVITLAERYLPDED